MKVKKEFLIKLHRVLQQVEWVESGQLGAVFCPVCRMPKNEHDDCEFDEVLHELTELLKLKEK